MVFPHKSLLRRLATSTTITTTPLPPRTIKLPPQTIVRLQQHESWTKRANSPEAHHGGRRCSVVSPNVFGGLSGPLSTRKSGALVHFSRPFNDTPSVQRSVFLATFSSIISTGSMRIFPGSPFDTVLSASLSIASRATCLFSTHELRIILCIRLQYSLKAVAT